jgi:hypothetical protein
MRCAAPLSRDGEEQVQRAHLTPIDPLGSLPRPLQKPLKRFGRFARQVADVCEKHFFGDTTGPEHELGRVRHGKNGQQQVHAGERLTGL